MDDDYLTLQQLHFEIDALKADLAAARETVFAEREVNARLRRELAELNVGLRESQLDTKVGYRLYEAAEARILELRGELAEVLAERDAHQSMCTQAQRELARVRARIEAQLKKWRDRDNDWRQPHVGTCETEHGMDLAESRCIDELEAALNA